MGAVDVVVVGLGPAGRALAHRCVARGLRVTAVDPHPERAWRATYSAWTDELPAWLPTSAVADCVARPSVWTTHRQTVERGYAVLSTSGLHSGLDLSGADVVAARATKVSPDQVLLGGAGRLRGRVVVDARGVGAAASRAQQTAYGVVLEAGAVDGTWFMDWRPDNGAPPGTLPSFLYVVPVHDGVLVEETCLVGRPALGLDELRTRLHRRLAARGVTVPADARVERVRFAVEAERVAGAFAFGARGGLGHPCTGYSVAASLAAADAVAEAIAQGVDPAATLHTPRTRAVDLLRRAGLRALLTMPPDDVAVFFAAFFALPVPAQQAFLSRRDDPRAVATAMARMSVAVPSRLRRMLVTSALDPRVARHIRALPPS